MKIYQVLNIAKSIFIDHPKWGMCLCLKTAIAQKTSLKDLNRYGMQTYKDLVANIPEFNPDFLEANSGEYVKRHIETIFWWPISDTTSRIKAFDKLIALYKNSDKEYDAKYYKLDA